jgi:hypothetical protein
MFNLKKTVYVTEISKGRTAIMPYPPTKRIWHDKD